MTEIYSGEEVSGLVEIPEGDSSVLARMKAEIPDINITVSDEPSDSLSAFIFQDHSTVEEVCLGLGGANSKREIKIQCLAYSMKESNNNLEVYWNSLRPLQEEVRKSYGDIRGYSSEELLEMMILDGCFILEFFRIQFLLSRRFITDIKGHPITKIGRRRLSIIFRDLLQVGNQIPFLILEGLFKICLPVSYLGGRYIPQIEIEWLYIIKSVFLDAVGLELPYLNLETSLNDLKPVHLLDFIRLFFRDSQAHSQGLVGSQDLLFQDHPHRNIPCISKLCLAGIKVNQENQDNYLGVAFQAGVIKMSRISLNELMCSFLENCIIFEHQYTSALKYISFYVLILDCLVDTADDVSYLRQRQVLEHRKGTDAEVANFINNLGTQMSFDGINSNFFKLCTDVNKYYKSESRKKWESFKKEYFDKPWLWISVLAGSVLLLLSCLQTYYTMHPQN